MTSFLNKNRPPVFCPGCTHERITKGLDKTLVELDNSELKAAWQQPLSRI